VASLLEVGTGFHPELTGRENIYLNGAILGMSRAEIRRKFDEIVAYAEVERFLDTPVKRYSSGMYVRLAFAVAAHLDPEILVIDEVLAVGDAEFQKKCLGKMGEVASRGRTVLFVSHNMAAVSILCDSGIVMRNGRIDIAGPASMAIEHYRQSLQTHAKTAGGLFVAPSGLHGDVKLLSASLSRADGSLASEFRQDEIIQVLVAVEVVRPMPPFRVGVRILGDDGLIILTSGCDDHLTEVKKKAVGRHDFQCTIPAHFLNSGRFALSFVADEPMRQILFAHDAALMFEVLNIGGLHSGIPERRPGLLRCLFPWRHVVTQAGEVALAEDAGR
jgi:lipopolysaccharide transport system ATP-binding protein